MKKALSLFLALALVVSFVPSGILTPTAMAAVPPESIIQDPNFYAAVLEIIGESDGYVITAADVAGITSLDVSNRNISGLTGIEHFSALEYLDCADNRLAALDINTNTALTSLWCRNNQLSVLDVSNNAALEMLNCGNNQLTELDVTSNERLAILYC